MSWKKVCSIFKAVGIGLNFMEFVPDKYEYSLTHWLAFAINNNSRISHNHLQFKLKIRISLIQGESQNLLSWGRPLRASSPAINVTLPIPPLKHVSEHHSYTSLKYPQGGSLYHFPGHPIPMPDNTFGDEDNPLNKEYSRLQ